MHYIQKHILDELRTVESKRYAQLNTIGVESSHFRYHLGQLVSDGYVEQLERGLYGLTQKGQQLVDKLSANRINPKSMPKVITYILLIDGDKVLLQEKQKQPYMGLLNMIGGKLHEGETAQAAATREVYEKTGVSIEAPALKGIFEVLISNEENLLTHAIAYVFTASVDTADFKHETIKVINAKDLSQIENLAPDFLPIFKRIQNSSDIATASLHIQS